MDTSEKRKKRAQELLKKCRRKEGYTAEQDESEREWAERIRKNQMHLRLAPDSARIERPIESPSRECTVTIRNSTADPREVTSWKIWTTPASASSIHKSEEKVHSSEEDFERLKTRSHSALNVSTTPSEARSETCNSMVPTFMRPEFQEPSQYSMHQSIETIKPRSSTDSSTPSHGHFEPSHKFVGPSVQETVQKFFYPNMAEHPQNYLEKSIERIKPRSSNDSTPSNGHFEPSHKFLGPNCQGAVQKFFYPNMKEPPQNYLEKSPSPIKTSGWNTSPMESPIPTASTQISSSGDAFSRIANSLVNQKLGYDKSDTSIESGCPTCVRNHFCPKGHIQEIPPFRKPQNATDNRSNSSVTIRPMRREQRKMVSVGVNTEEPRTFGGTLSSTLWSFVRFLGLI